MDGIYKCGCKEVYRFPHNIYYLSLLLLYLLFFAAASVLFLFLNVFHSLYNYIKRGGDTKTLH